MRMIQLLQVRRNTVEESQVCRREEYALESPSYEVRAILYRVKQPLDSRRVQLVAAVPYGGGCDNGGEIEEI